MPKIRILPDQLANQIAAGEVVERPASVVKELIENSLDAGADSIAIEIAGGGTRLIKVIDNGEGMDEDDVLLCLERHGTSKIMENDDLSDIRTLGFRGEAIPSISSVSKLTITSRRRDKDLGTTLICHYGTIKRVHEAGTRVGTTIEMSNLFGNTPARRKFLRTRRTELSHIDDTVKNYCLARPDVAFSFRIDDREMFHFDSDTDLKSRLASLINYSGSFIEINHTSSSTDSISVTGLLVSPDSHAPVAARLRIFVNDRAIKDRMLTHAVNEGMRSFLMKGRNPAGLIKIELPPAGIDVNVHPAKHEVRFRDSRIVHDTVSKAVRTAMIDHQQQIRHDIFSSDRSSSPQPAEKNFETEAVRDASEMQLRSYQQTELPPPTDHPGKATEQHRDTSTNELSEDVPAYYPPEDNPLYSTHPKEDYQEVRIEDLLVIGTFKDLYIFCRNGDKLVVIDQHAVHERLLYEELSSQYTRGTVASQQLLFPLSIELPPFQSQLLEKHDRDLESMGFSVRSFGGNTWILAAVPALAGTANPQDLLLDLLEQFGSDKEMSGGNAIINILATRACKAAVKAGDQLSDQEIRALLQKMIKADLFSHCPHGRPVVKILESSDIKKWFYRT